MREWESRLTIDPEAYHGFIYRIVHVETGRAYIGKKQFWCRRGNVTRESNWRSYWGSSEALAIDIKALGHDAFHREIIMLCKTPFLLTYSEVQQQMAHEVLTARLPDGTPAYYNRSVAGRWYARQFVDPIT